MSADKLVLRVERDGDVVRLRSPAVGAFTRAARSGETLSAGQVVGVLITLGRARELVVPDDVAGIVQNAAPELVHAPVGFDTLLYELGALRASAAPSPSSNAGAASGALVFRSPSAGRFWHRSAPGDPALASAGEVIETGKAVGVIEVMKTFTLVTYAAGPSLPPRARVVRVLAADGAEVAEKQPLFELAPA
jgi:biotin carboxyl carrier protein